jgi:DNA-binding CsgD family transcriptional regulator
MSSSSYANCHFCGGIEKAIVANTHHCPGCISKPKICITCGKTKKIFDNGKYQFSYNMSKDSLRFEDPFNDTCSDCQQAVRQTVRDEQGAHKSLKLSEAQSGIIEMVKQGLTNKQMAERLKIKITSLSALKSKTNGILVKAGMTFESFPEKVVKE